VPSDVGSGGSNAPLILAARRDDQAFAAWVNRWLAEFGFRAPFEVEDSSVGVFRLMVRTSPMSIPVNVADSGFGLSQVLPFIVHGAHATPGSTLIAEQPEIHLNPRLQVVLADLLVGMVRERRHVTVETHSEHLVTQLRLRVADGRLDPANVAFYYVDRGRYRSTVRELKLTPEGRWEEGQWPAEFFSESTTQALELLRARRRGRADA
jgi:predicted ATPase